MAGLYRLDRTLIRVSGPDAVGFLHNLLTQDVERLGETRVTYAALLTPQGKVIADMNLWADGDGDIVVEADPARGPDLLRRLSLYKLRANVTLRDESAERCVLFAPEPFSGAHPDPRLPDGALGWRSLSAESGADGGAVYDTLRIAAGVPDLARDAGVEEVFAGEALLDELNGVAFQKGCFVGQENVSRMKRRATTRKKFCLIAFDGPALPHGTAIRAGDAELGSVRSGVARRAIALLRLDRALAATAPLTAETREIRLAPPPWLILPDAAES